MQTNNHLSGVNLSNPYCQSLIQNTSTSFYAVVYVDEEVKPQAAQAPAVR